MKTEPAEGNPMKPVAILPGGEAAGADKSWGQRDPCDDPDEAGDGAPTTQPITGRESGRCEPAKWPPQSGRVRAE